MIFNAILFVNHLEFLYTIYTTYSSHASLVVSDSYPLESIHPVRKQNVVIFAHCPRKIYYICHFIPFFIPFFIPWHVPHHLRQTPFRFIHRTYPSHSTTLLSANLSVRPCYILYATLSRLKTQIVPIGIVCYNFAILSQWYMPHYL